MLKNHDPKTIDSKFKDIKKSDLSDQLAKLQRKCIEKDIPVVIIIEGFESSGKGYIINELVKDLDTRYYNVNVFDELALESDYYYIRQLWKFLPAYGNFSVLYRSMYSTLFNDIKTKKDDKKRRIKQIENFETLLNNDHFIILKFFMDIDEKTQKENIKKLEKDKYRSFFVSKEDKNQKEDYKKYREVMNDVLELTNFGFSKWNLVSAEDEKEAAKYVIGTSIELIEKAIIDIEDKRAEETKFKYEQKNIKESIKDLDTSKKLSDEEYDEVIDQLQDRAAELAFQLYTEKIPSVLVFEGIDAAGKGGSIKRLLRKIDPRIYMVNPTSAPSDLEKKHHYLWRFYNNLPKEGQMAIFDRSWYGRVMVERVEKYANELEWSRSFEEINNMESELVDHGVLLLKYHLVISKEEQEKRFKDREEEKPYKITDEDWRNREKWDDYIVAMDDMIANTSTKIAPWKVISSEDKKYARVEVLKDFIEKAEKILK